MNEELNRALEQISDGHLNEAIQYNKKRFPWLRAIAAVLVLAICWGAFWHELGAEPSVTEATNPILQNPTPSTGTAPILPTTPITPTPPAPITPTIPTPTIPIGPVITPLSHQVATPVYPQMAQCPIYSPDIDYQEYSDAYDRWYQSRQSQYDQPKGYADSLMDFWARSIPEFLSGEGNRTYSPVNVYLALAMLAEVTSGESRQQVLNLLGAESIEALRTQAGHVWNAHYCNDGETTSLLANSLWLDDAYGFKTDAIQTLADSYYASVFHGDLGTEVMNEHLRTWLNEQTGGLLEEQSENTKMEPSTVFALASTLYFAAGWDTEFSEKDTADSVFHAKNEDLTVPFMNQTDEMGVYYWGENFGAVCLYLTSGSMWLILPDEGKTVEDVLASSEYLEMTRSPADWKNKKSLKVNLSMPKFDISSQADLIEGMKKLGLTDVFISSKSDFSPMTDAMELYVSKIDHAVRVAVDEEGVLAAAYTVIMTEPGGVPSIPDDEIDFVLDRPFMFVVSSRNALPLFTGVVEQP